MLFIPPTLEKELKKQKRVFSVVIRPPKSNDASNLLLIREALINAFRGGKQRGSIDDYQVIDACVSTCGTEGHILFEYHPKRPIMNEDQIADLIQDAVIKINNKTGTVTGFTFGDLVQKTEVSKTSLPFTSIQFGMPPNLLDLKSLPIGKWENNFKEDSNF